MTSTDVTPVSGQVVSAPIDPTHVSAPHSFSAHDFFNVLRTVVKNTNAFVNESDKLAALNVIQDYESHIVPPSDQNVVVSEDDAAPVEDVSQRTPPMVGIPAPAAAAPAIDYNQLARALVQAQAEQHATADASTTEATPE